MSRGEGTGGIRKLYATRAVGLGGGLPTACPVGIGSYARYAGYALGQPQLLTAASSSLLTDH
jgi:hypothetical protein